MTYRDIITRLQDAGIENANSDAALLLEHFLGISRAQIFSFPERDYSSSELREAIARRCQREPLQYILGTWGFFGETYLVNDSCLIPRSDTELLVEKAIALLPRGAHFADLCTGSGCIAISTLKHREDCTALAIDLFPKTLDTAKQNAALNGVNDRLSFGLADILTPNALENVKPFDAILSNPPYIRTSALKTLEQELFSEPRAALDGGEDGLGFYSAILTHHTKHLKPDGFLLFEIGFDQATDILELAARHGYSAEIERDLSGNPRIALLRPL